MIISILVCDLTRNFLVRTYPIAKVLQGHYAIEVIGPIFRHPHFTEEVNLRNSIFEPYRHELPYKPVIPTKRRFADFFTWELLGQLAKQVQGDVVYAFKPRMTSFGVALLAKLSRRLPVILDIEDWEAEPFLRQPLSEKLYSAIRYANWPLNRSYDWFFERLIFLADERIVGSGFLQQRYGGVRLYHGADCSFFDPARYDSKQLKEEWGLTGKTIILFAGQASPHKGLEDLIAAVKMVQDDRLRMMVVGSSTGYTDILQSIAGDLMVRVGVQPHARMPELLGLSDLIVLPQRNTPYAQAQVPGKVFEAMAMAKPIIATSVSDLPEILSGCGWIVEPDNPTALAEAIRFILHHPDSAVEMGWRARKKCQEKYSWDAMEKVLVPIFQRYVGHKS